MYGDHNRTRTQDGLLRLQTAHPKMSSRESDFDMEQSHVQTRTVIFDCNKPFGLALHADLYGINAYVHELIPDERAELEIWFQ